MRFESLLKNKPTADQIIDLRSALEFLANQSDQLIPCTEPIDADAELMGVYKLVGAGPAAQPPTQRGPAVLFENVKGYDVPVVVGIFGRRERVAMMLNTTRDRLPFLLLDALNQPINPVQYKGAQAAPCQEVVHSDEFDVRKMLPAPTNTEVDGAPYFGMGLLCAQDPETGVEDVTIHRMGVQDFDKITIWFTPGRHIDAFRAKAEKQGKPLPVSINMGLDPAIYLSACFEPPTTPLGFDELSIAGALRGRPVEMVDCVSVQARALARAEIVLEGELLPEVRMAEDINSKTGYAMPEFPGYMGGAKEALPVMKVTAITHRKDPILQTTMGTGLEHCNLAGIPTEASILKMVENSMPGKCLNVYAHPAGGGKLLIVMQFKKSVATDEGCQRQAALLAFAAYSELKNVILVDEDVDIYSSEDVMWAMTTRFQGDTSIVPVPGVRCHPLDPSQVPAYSPSIQEAGVSCKTIFDCTVPFKLKKQFKRASFKDVDLKQFLPDFKY
ncbi:MAG: UbiD family decarboxylase [Desulfobacteraceae bacterium]|nr:UbiD family decarboxylase [Desulfobacteraceae bacterium]